MEFQIAELSNTLKSREEAIAQLNRDIKQEKANCESLKQLLAIQERLVQENASELQKANQEIQELTQKL